MLAAAVGLALAPATASAADCATTTTYASAGNYACSVPSGADVVLIGATGGHGSAGSGGSDGGGPGDYVAGWYVIGPGNGLRAGATLRTVVGSSNSGRTAPYGGGGSGGTGAETNGGGGGGASSVADEGGPLVVAGGGGGGGNLYGNYYTDTTFVGGAGGGSDRIHGAATTVAQRADSSGRSRVQLRFEAAKPLSLVASPRPRPRARRSACSSHPTRPRR